MPDPALPIPNYIPAVENGTVREYFDPFNRPMSGRVTAKQLDEPFMSVSVDLVEGRVTLPLKPGRYSIGAMLRDPDGVRAYTAEEITVSKENS